MPLEIAIHSDTIVPNDFVQVGIDLPQLVAQLLNKQPEQIDSVDLVLDVEKPTVETVKDSDIDERFNNSVEHVLITPSLDLVPNGLASLELSYKTAEHAHVVGMSRVDPRLGRYGYHMMTEINKIIDELPVIKVVACCRVIRALKVAILVIVVGHVVTHDHSRLVGVGARLAERERAHAIRASCETDARPVEQLGEIRDWLA